MPTYEYECTKCGEQFDYFQSIKEAPKEVCEKCGGKLTKLLSAGTGLIFKGSGFYITDYKNSGKTGEGSSSGAASKGSSEKSESSGSASGAKTESSAASTTPAKTTSSD